MRNHSLCYRSIFEPSGCFIEHPVLQCVQIKTMEPKAGEAGGVQRFRVVLSDVRNFIQTMIATGGLKYATRRLMKLTLCSRKRHCPLWEAEEGLHCATAEVQSSAG